MLAKLRAVGEEETRRMERLTAERLRAELDYDPATGIFTRRVRRGRRLAGSVAGNIDKADGYRRIMIDGKNYFAHRLAWFYVYGEWPPGQLDHKDTHRDHNWLDNLRPATNSQNQCNSRKRADNTSKFKGVTYSKRHRKWVAQITTDGKRHNLGYFATPELAHAAYAAEAARSFGEFARTA